MNSPRDASARTIESLLDGLDLPTLDQALDDRDRVWRELADRIPNRNRRGKDGVKLAADEGVRIGTWPTATNHAQRLGTRLVLAPGSLLPSHTVGLLSSHLGASPDLNMRWFESLRAAIENDSHATLVVTHSTTCEPWATHFAGKSGRSCLVLRVAPSSSDQNTAQWLYQSLLAMAKSPLGDRVLMSPPLESMAGRGLVLADEFTLAFVDLCYLLKLRLRGRLAPLVRTHLASTVTDRRPIRLAVGSGLVPKPIASELVASGAESWREFPDESPRYGVSSIRSRPAGGAAIPVNQQFLIHCTRRRAGPWPGQSLDDYRDDLLWDRPAADHSAMAALMRILSMRRIEGSTDAIRGDQPVVCFTEIPFDELARHQVYRTHRRRWDFGPHGIAIDRDWMLEHGARQVIYGDEPLWQSLDADRRTLFQRRTSRRGDHDWRFEREWRSIGSVDLDPIPAKAAYVFVPDAEAAALVRSLSRWPVIQVPPEWRERSSRLNR